MSKKHQKGRRAEIFLRRRNVLKGTVYTFFNKAIKVVNGRLVKVNPHICGEKERERARRTYQSLYLNEKVALFHPELGNLRSSPTLRQMSKRQFYDSGI